MKTRALLLLGFAFAGCATTTTARLHLPELQTVPHVDLGRYVGTWYEIANFPQSFQRGCTATTATYTLRDDGQIDVVNRCRKGSPDGPEKVARGRARVVDRSSAYSGQIRSLVAVGSIADSERSIGKPGGQLRQPAGMVVRHEATIYAQDSRSS